ncbi:MAG: NAD(P)/FAD-dependent oxidoreductase [Polyangiaceae bacterium]|jgi:phytoene dehydrogenase-like protein
MVRRPDIVTDRPKSVDVIVLGAGHNGLVAATLIARAGLDVLVLEEKDGVGGACKTERPFAKAPGLAISTGAYLLGLMPPELMATLNIEIPTVLRDPHYFLPTTRGKYVLFGSDSEATKASFLGLFTERDWQANTALQAEIAALREDLAKTWLEEPDSIEATAERCVRAPLREAFVALCRGSIGDYLARFDFESDLLRAMYAVTDGFSGLNGTFNTPGTGMNFLVHNMCRIPGSGGTFMIVRGGMGTVTARIADAARRAGARIETAQRVTHIRHDRGAVRGVVLADGAEIRSGVVVCNADPFRMRDLASRSALPADYNARIDRYARDGSTLKVNLAFRKLPRFACGVQLDGPTPIAPTIHLLPDESEVLTSLEESYADARAGRLPAFPAIEWYVHTTVDPAMRGAEGHHGGALFVQWVPHTLADGRSWSEEGPTYVRHLLSLCDRFAPGTSDLVLDTFALPPPAIENHFGITRGHIHHVDNSFGFADRLPYATPIAGLYSCSAGTHPAGSVIGCAGHNAAIHVLRDLGRS